MFTTPGMLTLQLDLLSNPVNPVVVQCKDTKKLCKRLFENQFVPFRACPELVEGVWGNQIDFLKSYKELFNQWLRKHLHILIGNGLIAKNGKAFNHVAKLAHIACPCYLFHFGKCFFSKSH